MAEHPGTTIDSRTLHAGHVFEVASDRVRLPNGRETTMDVVRHRASVILVPQPDPAHVVLVRQYRYCIDRWIWELPAGTLDSGEDVVTAARRECEEEIGQVPGHVERLGAFYPTPGYCDEVMYFFRLTALTRPTHPARPDDDEILTPRVVTNAEARRLIAEDPIVDMKSALGLSLI